MRYAYSGFDASGKPCRGVVETESEQEARDQLRKQGTFVAEIDAVATSTGAARAGSTKVGASRRLRAISTFARQLELLLSGGTPLVQALLAAERQSRHAGWKRVLADVRTKVEEGLPLSVAMRSHPEYFDSVCTSLAAAGETSGAMAPMLERLASLTRKELQLRNAVTGALTYPLVLLVISVSVLAVMLLFVLPRFADLFESVDAPLPPTTKFMLSLSGMLQTHGWMLLLGAAAAAVGGWLGLRHPGPRRGLDGVLLKVPRLSDLIRSVSTARLSRMLGVLLESKVPLVESLQLTRDSATNVHYAEVFARAEEAVTRGEPVSAVLGSSDLIHPSVQEALRTGEYSGQVGQPLIHMADFLDEENEIVIKSLTRMLEPLILGFLGVVVGMMAISMFLPLFDLVSSASGGAR